MFLLHLALLFVCFVLRLGFSLATSPAVPELSRQTRLALISFDLPSQLLGLKVWATTPRKLG